MKRVSILMLVFSDVDIAVRSMDAITKVSAVADIHVIENRSRTAGTCIRDAAMLRLAVGDIASYTDMRDNIGNNAFELILQSVPNLWADSDYVVITDGDLVPDGTGWLEEQCSILEYHPEIWACGITLDMTNLPVSAFPDAVNWVDPGVDREDYRLASTGLCLLMIRTSDLVQFVEWHKEHSRYRFGDTVLRKYAKRVATRLWAATRRSQARHLTWDRYADRDHQYTQYKTLRTYAQVWRHHKYCRFIVHTSAGKWTYVPWLHILRGSLRTARARLQCIGRPKPDYAWW